MHNCVTIIIHEACTFAIVNVFLFAVGFGGKSPAAGIFFFCTLLSLPLIVICPPEQPQPFYNKQ
jgi:hypothetical protein